MPGRRFDAPPAPGAASAFLRLPLLRADCIGSPRDRSAISSRSVISPMGFCVTAGSLPPCRAWLRVLATAPPGPAVRVRLRVKG